MSIQGECSVVIQRPVDEVYAYVSDFTKHHEWNYQILEITMLTEGPMEVGTRIRARETTPKNFPFLMKLLFPIMARVMGMQDRTEAEIVELQPGTRVAWKAESRLKSGQLGVRSEWSLDLESQDGATKLTQHYRYIPEHERAKKMMSDEQKTISTIEQEITMNLGNLKQILEGNRT